MDTTRTLGRIVMLAVVAIAAWAVPTWSDGQERKYSGTVVEVDRSAGAIVVESMGPRRVMTQVERRPIGVTASTEFVGVKRASGPAPSGWVGDFIESRLPGWQVKPGDWVTVIVTADGKRPMAVRIYVWEPTGS